MSDDAADIALPETLTGTVKTKTESDDATVITVEFDETTAAAHNSNVRFIQTQALTKVGVAVHPYGAIIIPESQAGTTLNLSLEIDGTIYTDATVITAAVAEGATITFTKQA